MHITRLYRGLNMIQKLPVVLTVVLVAGFSRRPLVLSKERPWLSLELLRTRSCLRMWSGRQ